LLLIDDGSSDKSGMICDEYALKDMRIRVFHKENGGVSSARNLGLDYALGKWITFVDSDDWIDPSYIDSIYHPTDDLVITAYITHTKEKHIFQHVEVHKSIEVKEIGDTIFSKTCFSVPWGKGFKNSIIKSNKIKFDTQMNSHEDTLFVYKYLANITYLSFTNKVCYHYRNHEEGLSSKLIDFKEIEYGIRKFSSIISVLCIKCGINYKEPLMLVACTYMSKINLYGSYKQNYRIVQNISTNSLLCSLFTDKQYIRKGKRRRIIDILFRFKQHHIISFITIITRRLY
jgi:glycosyltransferase involved in cell wall biosynthesis